MKSYENKKKYILIYSIEELIRADKERFKN